MERDLGFDLSYQGAEQELASLPGKYTPPLGRLLLAVEDRQPLGCIALRPLEPGVCEMKRMYVRPGQRGSGVGRALAVELIAQARQAGYRSMRLDTEVSLVAAQRLYQSLGFRIIEPYYQVPSEILPRTVFMQLDL